MNGNRLLELGCEAMENRLRRIMPEANTGPVGSVSTPTLSGPDSAEIACGLKSSVHITDTGLPGVRAVLTTCLTQDPEAHRFTLEVALEGGAIGATGVALASTTHYRAKLVSASLGALVSPNCPLWQAVGAALKDYVRHWRSMSTLAREVTRRRYATQAEPVGLGDIAQELAQLGYELDREAVARYTGQNLSGAGAGESYPGCSYAIRDVLTKRGFAHFEGRRDAGFQALQKLRGTRYAIVRGAVLDL